MKNLKGNQLAIPGLQWNFGPSVAETVPGSDGKSRVSAPSPKSPPKGQGKKLKKIPVSYQDEKQKSDDSPTPGPSAAGKIFAIANFGRYSLKVEIQGTQGFFYSCLCSTGKIFLIHRKFITLDNPADIDRLEQFEIGQPPGQETSIAWEPAPKAMDYSNLPAKPQDRLILYLDKRSYERDIPSCGMVKTCDRRTVTILWDVGMTQVISWGTFKSFGLASCCDLPQVSPA